MAKKPSILVGLELDPSGITAAAVTTSGGLEIKHAVTTTLDPGIVRDGEVGDVDALAEALRDMWRDEKGLDRRVRIGIANQKIVVRVLELPPIADAKELEQAVRFQAQDHIPMPLDAAVLDFQTLEVVDTPQGRRQRVLLVAARRDMLDRVLGAARAAGLRPEGIDLSAFAMVRALAPTAAAAAAAPGETVLYISIGGVTNLAIATGVSCTFTRVVGAGLEQLAVELAERRQLTLHHARGWLTHVGTERPLDDIDGDLEVIGEARTVLQEGVRRIAADVRHSIDFHHAQGAASAVARCVLTGPAAAVPGFADAFGVELGVPVHVGAVPGGPQGMGPNLAIAAGLSIPEALAA
ncbi:type IV pilus assembly protein PilM [Paraconexibacter sp.]|uniref:type IV pilus assembly protein PilM n=1 Tax=Paraconexibacter sp. TaxID=2949640 RepID=UPI003565105E